MQNEMVRSTDRSAQKLVQVIKGAVSEIERRGMDKEAVLNHCQLQSCGSVHAPNVQQPPRKNPPGACPTREQIMRYLERGLCSYNRLSSIGNVVLTTNTVSLPDATFDFEIGPNDQALGIDLPTEWVAETFGKGIYRLKVAFVAQQTSGAGGALSNEQIETALLRDMNFRILQDGTQDNLDVALDIGSASDAETSELAPSMGGFYLAPGDEFVPFAFAPELFSFDFSGRAPGTEGVDTYTARATIRTYWRDI